MIVLNIVSLIAYEITVQFLIKGIDIDVFISVAIGIIQLSIIWLIKYRESNFHPWTDITVVMYLVLITIMIIIFYIPFMADMKASTTASTTGSSQEGLSSAVKGLILLFAYFLVIIYSMLYLEY